LLAPRATPYLFSKLAASRAIVHGGYKALELVEQGETTAQATVSKNAEYWREGTGQNWA